MKPLLVLLPLLLIGCASDRPAKSITPNGIQSHIDWTTADDHKDVARRDLFQNESSSHFVIRLKGAEPPHIHDKSDMTVFLRSGAVRLHLGDRIIDMQPGDVAFIPRGMYHWGANSGSTPAEAYVVATPPMDPNDRRIVPAK